MFRFLFAAFALFWMASLFFGADGAAAGAGFLLLAPIFFLFKFLFIIAIMGFMFRAFGGRPRSWTSESWKGPRPTWGGRRRPAVPEKSAEERFEEWHDLAHARREVDRWGTYDL